MFTKAPPIAPNNCNRPKPSLGSIFISKALLLTLKETKILIALRIYLQSSFQSGKNMTIGISKV